jgi:hypothetical protein
MCIYSIIKLPTNSEFLPTMDLRPLFSLSFFLFFFSNLNKTGRFSGLYTYEKNSTKNTRSILSRNSPGKPQRGHSEN